MFKSSGWRNETHSEQAHEGLRISFCLKFLSRESKCQNKIKPSTAELIKTEIQFCSSRTPNHLRFIVITTFLTRPRDSVS